MALVNTETTAQKRAKTHIDQLRRSGVAPPGAVWYDGKGLPAARILRNSPTKRKVVSTGGPEFYHADGHDLDVPAAVWEKDADDKNVMPRDHLYWHPNLAFTPEQLNAINYRGIPVTEEHNMKKIRGRAEMGYVDPDDGALHVLWWTDPTEKENKNLVDGIGNGAINGMSIHCTFLKNEKEQWAGTRLHHIAACRNPYFGSCAGIDMHASLDGGVPEVAPESGMRMLASMDEVEAAFTRAYTTVPESSSDFQAVGGASRQRETMKHPFGRFSSFSEFLAQEVPPLGRNNAYPPQKCDPVAPSLLYGERGTSPPLTMATLSSPTPPPTGTAPPAQGTAPAPTGAAPAPAGAAPSSDLTPEQWSQKLSIMEARMQEAVQASNQAAAELRKMEEREVERRAEKLLGLSKDTRDRVNADDITRAAFEHGLRHSVALPMVDVMCSLDASYVAATTKLGQAEKDLEALRAENATIKKQLGATGSHADEMYRIASAHTPQTVMTSGGRPLRLDSSLLTGGPATPQYDRQMLQGVGMAASHEDGGDMGGNPLFSEMQYDMSSGNISTKGGFLKQMFGGGKRSENPVAGTTMSASHDGGDDTSRKRPATWNMKELLSRPDAQLPMSAIPRDALVPPAMAQQRQLMGPGADMAAAYEDEAPAQSQDYDMVKRMIANTRAMPNEPFAYSPRIIQEHLQGGMPMPRQGQMGYH